MNKMKQYYNNIFPLQFHFLPKYINSKVIGNFEISSKMEFFLGKMKKNIITNVGYELETIFCLDCKNKRIENIT